MSDKPPTGRDALHDPDQRLEIAYVTQPGCGQLVESHESVQAGFRRCLERIARDAGTDRLKP